MKKLTIAFLYNVRHRYPDVNDPRSHLEADFDDPRTIETIIKHLKNCGFKVIPIEANKEAYLKLYRQKEEIDLALNYSEGIWGHDREAHLPSMLEMLEIPYTGSSPLTQALGLNKAKTKEILLTHHLPTLPYQLFQTGQEELDPRLNYPLIVKPVSQGSSAGITNKSVVFKEKELRRRTKWVIATFHQPALVEPFLTGREFSVSMLGNPPKILPIIEADHSLLPKKYLPLDSLEVKWFFEDESSGQHLICPAKIKKSFKKTIEAICLKIWQVLMIRDYCRIDIRCDQKNYPYVLEINSPPGLIPPEVSLTSYFPLAARVGGIDYEELLKRIINTARERL